MANVSAYLEKAYLDWASKAAAVTQPTGFFAAIGSGIPTSVAASEFGSAFSGYSRQSLMMGPATSPAGSATNATAMTFGPFTSAGTAIGVTIWDAVTNGSTNMLWYGTLATSRIFVAGDTLVFAVGALTLTMS